MTPSSAPLRVTVIEDNPRYRHSLETLFQHSPGFALAASYGSALAALDHVDERLRFGAEPAWDIVLMDIELPGLGGSEATRQLKKRLPHLPVVVLTVFEEPATILEAITAGADGYLLKKTSAPEMLAQLRVIVSGGAPLTAFVARTVLDLLRAIGTGGAGNAASPQPQSFSSPTRFDLTDREQEVLQCLVRGQSYKQSGEQLGISIDTVRTHIRGIYKKLQVHTVAEAVARAIRERVV